MGSLKSIEMQVALPRTHDVAKLQESMQQRGTHVHEHMHASVKKETIKSRSEVEKMNQKDKNHINRDEQSKKQNNQGPSSEGEKKGEDHREAKHPFKGNFIDFSG